MSARSETSPTMVIGDVLRANVLIVQPDEIIARDRRERRRRHATSERVRRRRRASC